MSAARFTRCNSTMFESKRKRSACRALADTTTTTTATATSAPRRMSLCRACLVLLGTEDAVYDLYQEKDLAAKFFGCMGARDDLGEERNPQLMLKCICECCYQLVQKFHDFQCMCQESLRNFKNLMQEVGSHGKEQEQTMEREILMKDALPPRKESVQTPTELMEEIEEVYIMEDESVKDILDKEKTALCPRQGITKRPRCVRHKMDCPICSRGFYKMSLYEAHMRKHRGEEPYKCCIPNCKKTYARANLLAQHLRVVHQNEASDTFPCMEPDCSKVYTALRSLNYHVRRHHSVEHEPKTTQRHICDKCGKSFGRRAHLTRHQLVHRSKNDCDYECDGCGKRFYTKQNLNDHYIRRHSNNTIFRCRPCGRIFPSRTALADHMKRHLKKHRTI